MAAHQGRYLRLVYAEYLSSRGGVDVLAGAERLLHGFVIGNVGKHPQLNLAIVRIHQHTAPPGDKHLPDFRTQVGAYRDVLQVRLGGGQPPGGGDEILEGGVDSAVGADFFHQSISIGGFQLGEHPVVRNGRDDGMGVFQLFQHIRIGGVAGFGLLHRGQRQLFKQHLAQLLGGIDVEATAGIAENQRLTVINAGRQHFPELLQLHLVNGNAPLLHFVQHVAQGQLNLLIQLRHAAAFQLLPQRLLQEPHRLGAAHGILVLHVQPQEGGGKLGNRIVGLGGIQVVCCQRRVKGHLSAGNRHLLQPVTGGFGVMENQLRVAAQAHRVHLRLHGGEGAFARLPGNAQAAVRCHIQGALAKICRNRRRGQLLHLGGLLGSIRCHTPQTVFVNQTHKFQLLEQPIQLLGVIGLDQGILGGKIDGGFRHNGCQFIGQIRLVPTVFQLLPQFGADGSIFQMRIHSVQAAELCQQLLGGFGANPGNAGDIVGGIAHQGFQVNQLFRLEAVFLLKQLLGVQRGGGLPRLGDDKLYVHIPVNQLQAVPVTGDDDALPGVVGADFAHRANHIVRFPALAFINGNAHGLQHLLHNGHLLGKLLRHGVAGGFVAVIFLVAEGGAVEVKGNCHGIGLLLLLHPFQNVQKAENRMGI